MRPLAGALALACALSGCGGGSAPGDTRPDGPALPADPISAPTLVPNGCTGGGAASAGSFFANAEVEPTVAVAPGNSNHLVAAWQQDRWTDGGARALVTAASFDGGRTWRRTLQAMSRCGGGSAAVGGDYERVSDPWVDIGPDGTVHAMGLGFSGSSSSANANAMLATRSTDGGLTWSAPATLIADGADFFNDKNTLTADPTDPRFVYAVWDRIDNAGGGPTYFARSTDGGRSWEPARSIHDPGRSAQTIGNRIVVITDGPQRGTLVNFFTGIDYASSPVRNHLAVMRSTDQGVSWSVPVVIAAQQSVGTRDATTGTPIRDGSIIGSIAAGPGAVLWAAWQDARFSGGVRDAIAVARSDDGGLSWSASVAVNRDPSAPAFTPVVAVRSDGLAGVMHYDLRPDTADPATLLAGAWLVSSRDGIAWSEATVWSPFDLAGAPRVGAGLFLGDYQGLVASGVSFRPVVALSSGDPANRTDIFAPRLEGPAAYGAPSGTRTHKARAVPRRDAVVLGEPGDDEFARRVSDNTVATMERRLPGWSRRVGPPREPR